MEVNHTGLKFLLGAQGSVLDTQLFAMYINPIDTVAGPEINMLLVPDIMSVSQHFVTVTRNAYQSSVYDMLLKFENLLAI